MLECGVFGWVERFKMILKIGKSMRGS